MKKIEPMEYVVYVYQVTGSPDFYVNTGQSYARFVWLTGRFCFVRMQPRLPAYASGCCVSFTLSEKQALEAVAGKNRVALQFFENAQDCLEYALGEIHEQYIFGKNAPAGYFWVDSAFRGRDEE